MFRKKKAKSAQPQPPPATTHPGPPRTNQPSASETAKKLGRENDRAVMRTQREMQRERARLEAEERKMMSEIKALGKQGRMNEARMLAKNLVRIRQAKERTYQASSQMTAISYQAKMAATNSKMVEMMQATTGVMKNSEAMMNPQQQQNIMMQFGVETEKYNLNQEMNDEMMDSILGGEEIDAGTDDVLNSVLDEIGLEVASSTATHAPSIRPQPIQQQQAVDTRTEDELIDRIARLG